jgi:iron-sulfur cluster assembly protein
MIDTYQCARLAGQLQDRQREAGAANRQRQRQAELAAHPQGRPNGALRVAVIGGGCSGLQYKMDLVDGPANRDIMVMSQNVRVVIDPKSALFVSGSVLDFSDDLQKGGFKVTNPNAEAHCSCGESFAA